MPVGADSKVLTNFIDFAGAQGTSDSVTTKIVFDWLDATTKECFGNAAKRFSLVRQFLFHLSAAFPETQVPETRLISGRRRPTPFVFTADETELLLKGAAQFAAEDFFSVVLQTILGLISAYGLRASEALGLDRTDVALQDNLGTLLIRESKFNKSRIVPLHSSTAQHLADYAEQRDHLASRLRTTAFFVSRRRRHCRTARYGSAFGLSSIRPV
jgi:integrase